MGTTCIVHAFGILYFALCLGTHFTLCNCTSLSFSFLWIEGWWLWNKHQLIPLMCTNRISQVVSQCVWSHPHFALPNARNHKLKFRKTIYCASGGEQLFPCGMGDETVRCCECFLKVAAWFVAGDVIPAVVYDCICMQGIMISPIVVGECWWWIYYNIYI